MRMNDINKRIEEFIACSQQPAEEPMLPGTVRGMERLAQIVEQQDDQPYDVQLEEGRDCLMCEGSGIHHDPVNSTFRCPHCHGRGWLKATNFEPRPLFTVHEMAVVEMPWGVRHDESSFWHSMRFASREHAEAVRDGLILAWLEGNELILVENFQSLTNEVMTRLEAHKP